jgi:hypothetical protein
MQRSLKNEVTRDVQAKIFRINEIPEPIGILSADQVREKISEWIQDYKELPLPNGAVVFFDSSCEELNVPVSFAVSEMLGGYGISINGTAIMIPPPVS